MGRKICMITGTRADWGLLRLPALAIAGSRDLDLQIIATAAHLSDEFGHTVDEITAAGFAVDAQIPMLEPGDDAVAITRSLGRGIIGFADAFNRLQPDIVMILGDRYEMLGVAEAALIARIPVAHLCGGDVTEGAFDDAIRHAITKLSHLHFVTNSDAARRVRQLGENPLHIHPVGSPGIDAILQVPRLSRAELFADLGVKPGKKLVTVTFHPPTLDEIPAEAQMQILLAALAKLKDDVAIILTGSNADTHGRTLTRMAREFAGQRARTAFRINLGQQRYFSALAHSDAVIGNSSSGLYEAPSFNLPTVNIGDRQHGRIKASSVIDCPVDKQSITDAVERAFRLDCTHVENPYGDGAASGRIVKVLENLTNPQLLIKKQFHNMQAD